MKKFRQAIWTLAALVGLVNVTASCGDDALSCEEARTCLLADGEQCSDSSQCESDYCGSLPLPYSVQDTDTPVCLQKPSCTLEGCNVCARLGELGRTDGPQDQPVCVDACYSNQEKCSLCGCGANSKCNPQTDLCESTIPPLLSDGSACNQDSDCVNQYCRDDKDSASKTGRVCASHSVDGSDGTNCWGGTWWSDANHIGTWCLTACDSQADCGERFACMPLANGDKECRLRCDAPSCSSSLATKVAACLPATKDVEGNDVQACPGSPGISAL
jgi:hypothetical protein